MSKMGNTNASDSFQGIMKMKGGLLANYSLWSSNCQASMVELDAPLDARLSAI